jgi:hypothetical protein
MNTNHKRQSASVCSTRFAEGFIIIFYRWQSPEWNHFFSPAGNDLNARGREVEHIHTYINIGRERERTIKKSSSSNDWFACVYYIYILHNIIHIQLMRWGFTTDIWVEWISEEKIDEVLENATRTRYCRNDYLKAIYRWEIDMNL